MPLILNLSFSSSPFGEKILGVGCLSLCGGSICTELVFVTVSVHVSCVCGQTSKKMLQSRQTKLHGEFNDIALILIQHCTPWGGWGGVAPLAGAGRGWGRHWRTAPTFGTPATPWTWELPQARDGRYPKNSYGRLVGRLVGPLFVVQLVVQLIGYWNSNSRQFLID